AQCLAHNAEPGFINVGETTRNFYNACVGGCDFRAGPGSAITSVGDSQLVTGVFEFTGDPCVSEQPEVEEEVAKEVKPQECIPQPDGQTFCVKSNGEQCFTGGSDYQVCWRAGEIGEKSSGP